MGYMRNVKCSYIVKEEIRLPNQTKNPRLVKLIIKNFRCIGERPVEIELDDIVILVGPNNAGKSSILKAYELIMSDGSKGCQLEVEDFPNGDVCSGHYPEIELHTVVYDNSPWGKVDKGTAKWGKAC